MRALHERAIDLNRRRDMQRVNARCASLLALGIAALVAACAGPFNAGSDAAVRVGENDLGGVVTGAMGPEAGVWVIAETTDLPTKMARIVVTDDRGRYLVPDLPKA